MRLSLLISCSRTSVLCLSSYVKSEYLFPLHLNLVFPSVDAVSVVVDNESQNNSQGRVQHRNVKTI